jgi:hypothetical protein
VKLGRITPILRIFDEVKAREFYVGFPGFAVAWEHRFGGNSPLYLQLSRDGPAEAARPGSVAGGP